MECLVFVSFGAPVAMLGAGWPDARDLFGQSSGALGWVAGAYGVGRLVTATSALPMLRRWHIRHATAANGALLAASGASVALTRSFPVLVAAFLVNGLASGCLDALGNRFQTVVRSVGSAGLMFGSFGVGATIGPVLVAALGWTTAFLIASGAALAGAAAARSHRLEWPAALQSAEPPHGDHSRLHVPRWVIALSLSLFAIYCGIEATTGSWGASYLEGDRGASEATAAWAMSGFWAGMTLGRLGLGLLSGPGRPLTAARTLIISGTLATAVYVAIPLVPVPVSIALFGVAGVSLAALFPTLISTTADRVGVGATGRVMGWQLLSANLSVLVLSGVVGVAVDLVGTGASTAIMAGLGLVGLPLLLVSTRLHAGDSTVPLGERMPTGPPPSC